MFLNKEDDWSLLPESQHMAQKILPLGICSHFGLDRDEVSYKYN